jgi:hypothetical protein
MADSRSILAVPGLAATSPEFRAALWDLAARNGWDVDALAAVMSGESGFRAAVQNPLPGQTATGLIQFIESTAKSLGTTTAELRKMTAVHQLPFVEKYYRRAFAGKALERLRPVDYYIAVFQASHVGKPTDFVFARSSDPLTLQNGTQSVYTLNKGLDRDKDGALTVADLVDHVATIQGRAGGKRIDASPVPVSGAQLVVAAAPALLAIGLLGAVLAIRKASKVPSGRVAVA